MKRVILCAAILCVIIIQSVVSLAILGSKNRKLDAVISEAVKLAEAGDTQGALAKTDEIVSCWDDYYVTVSYLVQTSKLEDLSYSVSKLKALLEKDSEEFFSECSLIRYGIELIYKNEFPDLHSVL